VSCCGTFAIRREGGAIGMFFDIVQDETGISLLIAAGLSLLLNVAHYYLARHVIPKSLWYIFESRGIPRSILRGFTLALLLVVLSRSIFKASEDVTSTVIFVWFICLNIHGILIRSSLRNGGGSGDRLQFKKFTI
jgi:hypothetical protein